MARHTPPKVLTTTGAYSICLSIYHSLSMSTHHINTPSQKQMQPYPQYTHTLSTHQPTLSTLIHTLNQSTHLLNTDTHTIAQQDDPGLSTALNRPSQRIPSHSPFQHTYHRTHRKRARARRSSQQRIRDYPPHHLHCTNHPHCAHYHHYHNSCTY